MNYNEEKQVKVLQLNNSIPSEEKEKESELHFDVRFPFSFIEVYLFEVFLYGTQYVLYIFRNFQVIVRANGPSLLHRCVVQGTSARYTNPILLVAVVKYEFECLTLSIPRRYNCNNIEMVKLVG